MAAHNISTLGLCSAFLRVHRVGQDDLALKTILDQAIETIQRDGRTEEPTSPAALEVKPHLDPDEILTRFRRIDPYCTHDSADAHLVFERTLGQTAHALHQAGILPAQTRDVLIQAGEDYTKAALDFAVRYFLTQGDSSRLKLEQIPKILEECDGGLPGRWLWMELESATLVKVYGRTMDRFPGDPFTLPAPTLPGYLNCVRALSGLIASRILAFTDMEEEARDSMLDRFEKRFAQGTFQSEEVLEPVYRFRPVNLSFQADPDTAMEYYRTEQKLKEQVVRLASQDCLHGRFGLRMVFEVEAFTLSLVEYARRAASTLWEGDRPRLYVELPRLVNLYRGTVRRVAFLRALWHTLPPQEVGERGVSGLLETIREMQRTHGTLDSLLALIATD